MLESNREPYLNKTSFYCPHCNVYSNQTWFFVYAKENPHNSYVGQVVDNARIALCTHCQQYNFWVGHILIYPEMISVDSPNEDLPEDIQNDYREAALIYQKSPRAAAALLRLCIEKLCIALGKNKGNLSNKIGELVKDGLSAQVQKMLDTVRVIGNDAVHAVGQIDQRDTLQETKTLFKLVNLIADKMISEPKHVDNLFQEIVPEEKKKQIEIRDSQE